MTARSHPICFHSPSKTGGPSYEGRQPSTRSRRIEHLQRFMSICQYRGPLVAEIVQIISDWDGSGDGKGILVVEATISMILARVQPRDDPWFILASKSLGISEAVIRHYAARGDSLSLSILNPVARQQCSNNSKSPWPAFEISNVLREFSMYKMPCLNCSTSSARCGIKSFASCRISSMGGWRSLLWH